MNVGTSIHQDKNYNCFDGNRFLKNDSFPVILLFFFSSKNWVIFQNLFATQKMSWKTPKFEKTPPIPITLPWYHHYHHHPTRLKIRAYNCSWWWNFNFNSFIFTSSTLGLVENIAVISSSKPPRRRWWNGGEQGLALVGDIVVIWWGCDWLVDIEVTLEAVV